MSTDDIFIPESPESPECPECGEQGCLAMAQIGYTALMDDYTAQSDPPEQAEGRRP